MSSRLMIYLVVVGAATLGAACLWWWAGSTGGWNTEQPFQSTSAPEMSNSEPPATVASTPRTTVASDHGEEVETPLTEDERWEVTKRACPWPPRADEWRELDVECLASMAYFLDDDQHHVLEMVGAPLVRPVESERLRTALADADRIRDVVEEALDRVECWVPKGAVARPGLRDACAADDMERLAMLHRWCSDVLGRSGFFETEMSVELDNLSEVSASQDEYYDGLDQQNMFKAAHYWGLHKCRSLSTGAMIPLDRLPQRQQYVTLFSLAQRLGASSPELVESTSSIYWAAPKIVSTKKGDD